MKAILLIDHGSRRAAANAMLHEVAALVQELAGTGVLVEPAHMELSEPSIASAFALCVSRGASEVIAVPYMLSPGRHVTEDIPRLVSEAAAEYRIPFQVMGELGVHTNLARVVLERARVTVARRFPMPVTAAESGLASFAEFSSPATNKFSAQCVHAPSATQSR